MVNSYLPQVFFFPRSFSVIPKAIKKLGIQGNRKNRIERTYVIFTHGEGLSENLIEERNV